MLWLVFTLRNISIWWLLSMAANPHLIDCLLLVKFGIGFFLTKIFFKHLIDFLKYRLRQLINDIIDMTPLFFPFRWFVLKCIIIIITSAPWLKLFLVTLILICFYYLKDRSITLLKLQHWDQQVQIGITDYWSYKIMIEIV